MKDARNKGRLWMQKLLPKDVWMIRWLRSKGERQKDVADLFQISHVTIYDIERERGWT
jgi:DNA-binding XRE family transcriptional regulator